MPSPARDVTFIYPYYENPVFLRRQVQNWLDYPLKLRQHVKVIVVDDGSPKFTAQRALRGDAAPKFLRLFRVEVDVRWNWLAARNIGAHHAADGWLLLTDMDHVVPADTLDSLINGEYSSSTIYRFSRREHTGVPIHPHPNSWFMTRKMYWRVGGYDEALSGHYGTDGEYRRRCAATAPVIILPYPLERHEYQGDSSTTHYLRKQPEDAAGKALARSRRGIKPLTLTFPYHEEHPGR